ncbi:MAG TPA: quinone oxidoreductase [Thermoanaerobaculia bacterium]|jgi:NADPH2:quinone reductase|nr:quinone oxidoreductase [Thermoanaerobaculia bacterium]
MKAIRIHTLGGPEVLQLEDVPEPAPKEGEAVVRVEAAGVNFIDVYFRTGLYKGPALPFTLGQEAAGTVAALGAGVADLSVGDRVAYTGVHGAYAELAAVPAARLVKLPAGLSTRQGAAAMLQGITAHYLATSTYSLKEGDACLIHAAAGGVGQLLCQVAKLRGARVLGTVSTEKKAQLAREAGADEVIRYDQQDFAAEVKRLTGGHGVQVVYDGVGRATFDKGLDSLARRGMMVLFGQASGPVPPFDPSILNTKGSLYLTRPSLGHYIATAEELQRRAEDVLGWIAEGKLKVGIGLELPLAEAAEAHRALEGRRTTGKVLLIP